MEQEMKQRLYAEEKQLKDNQDGWIEHAVLVSCPRCGQKERICAPDYSSGNDWADWNMPDEYVCPSCEQTFLVYCEPPKKVFYTVKDE